MSMGHCGAILPAPQCDDNLFAVGHSEMVKISPLKLPIALPATVAAVALVLVVMPFPGEGFSVVTTHALSRAGFAVPGMMHISDATLALLAAATLVTLVWSWKENAQLRPVAVFSAVGVVIAYGTSEALKLLVQQDRPCGRWPSVGECDLTDYSFPSNHATLAFGALMAIVFVLDQLSVKVGALILAVTVAAARVFEGAHYLHDVAVGAVLGIVIPGILGGVVFLRVQRQERKGQ